MKPSNGNQRLEELKRQLETEVERSSQALLNAEQGNGSISELVHSLQVYQTELEMQNQALEEINNDNESLRIYYSSLFALSPLACLVIDQRLFVKDSNDAAKKLLKIDDFSLVPNFNLYAIFSLNQTQEISLAISQSKETRKSVSLTLEVGGDNNRDLRFLRIHVKALKPHSADLQSILLLIEDISAESILSRQKDSLLSVIDNARDVLLASDLKGEIRVASESVYSWFDLDPALGSKNLIDRLPPKLTSAIRSYLNDRVLQRRSHEEIVELDSIDSKKTMYLQVRCFPILNETRLDGAGFIFTDSTLRIQQEQELKLALKVFNEGQQAIMVTDANFRIVQINSEFEAITGFTPSEVTGLTPEFLAADMKDGAFSGAFWQQLEDLGHWEGETWSKRKDGTLYLQWISISAYLGDGNETTHYIAVFRDITEQRKNELRIEKLAFYDVLTECGNRRLLKKILEEHTQEKGDEPLILFFFDLDLFKKVNDMHGHEVGDKLLVAVCSRVKNLVKKTDQVFRLGGDEFAILLNEIPESELGNKASSLVQACQSPFYIDKLQLQVSISLGIVRYPDDGSDYNTLLKHADLAMYQVKENGRSGYQFFDSELLSTMTRNIQIEQYMKGGLKNKEFYLLYMPIIHCESKKMVGVELLMRWTSKKLGVIEPKEFIPIAERSNMIHQITDHVLDEAIRGIQEIKKMYAEPFYFSINISRIDFDDNEYFSSLVDKLVETGVAENIILEITEKVLLEHIDNAIEKMKYLKKHKIRISIDDFGIGFSSLSYLSNFLIDEIKIDRSFVANLESNEKSANVCKAMIALANAVGCQCVAEGIENTQQERWLTYHGCEFVQGYLMGEPMSIDEVKEKLLIPKAG